MTNPTPFNADWASPPGDLIQEFLEVQGWSYRELASRLGIAPKYVEELLDGRSAITANTADRLEKVLGHKAEFWLRLEENYQKDLLRIASY